MNRLTIIYAKAQGTWYLERFNLNFVGPKGWGSAEFSLLPLVADLEYLQDES